ncbi:MAG: general secretion pathway protein M [Candidatus Magnetoglobus multicellularis str. Araruama]|uniref:General secretion pathway protein M n=1 Tax=Candidatus Magnetoglobus multicellularis str. Araruama TaxID=890399 RepID=A0A1V1PG32_9BACT|nr:MAG: general secretion pathway protein M [Candidatus Magnetoglobus multicellularis str. Araruama]
MKLGRREKILVYLALIMIIGVVSVQFVIFPFMDERERLKANVRYKTKALKELYALKNEFDLVQHKANTAKAKMARRKKNFSLYSFLEKVASEAGLKSHVEKMQDNSSKNDKDSPYKVASVEMKLKDITLEQLSPFLYKIEKSRNNLTIGKIVIKEHKKNEGYINVSLQVMTIET